MTQKLNRLPLQIFLCGLAFLFILLVSLLGNMNRLVSFFDKPLCKNCNIILVSLDTLSANHLPCYGYARNTAPNLCTFAENNILFKNAFAKFTRTLPSNVSIFTGQFPSTHGVNTALKD